MRITTTFSFVLLALALFPLSCPGRESGKAHERALIRARQARSWSNHGTEVYLAPDIDSSQESYSDEELGNVVIDRRSHVRKVHVSPRLIGNLDCEDRLRIGVVEVEKGARVDEITSDTEIRGEVSAPDAVIGGVLAEEGAQIKRVDITTIIKGGVHAR